MSSAHITGTVKTFAVQVVSAEGHRSVPTLHPVTRVRITVNPAPRSRYATETAARKAGAKLLAEVRAAGLDTHSVEVLDGYNLLDTLA